jgi:outer membrane protein assembly factor BamE (lipoprotein component of BamABCDE complex)
MRTRTLIAALALGSLALAGCTTTETATTTTTTRSQTDPSNRVYSQDQLQATGEAQTGPALERVDPSISRAPNR